MYWSGVEGDNSIMIMELLGPNLEEQRINCGKKLTLNTVAMLGLQLVDTYYFIG